MAMLFDTAIVECIERHFVLFCVLVFLVFVNKVVLECTTSTSEKEVFTFNCGLSCTGHKWEDIPMLMMKFHLLILE
jgi:hypothetical protein